MRALIFSLYLFLALPIAAARAEPANWRIDYAHSEIRFSWDHFGVSVQHAEFGRFTGQLILDREAITASQVDVTIDMASLNSGYPLLDEHLQAVEWFDSPHFPEARFVSTRVRRTGVNTALVDGDLTLKGVTRPVTLEVRLTYDGPHPLTGVVSLSGAARTVGFTAQTTVLRSDFGMTNSRPLISDEIAIDITVEAELRLPGN